MSADYQTDSDCPDESDEFLRLCQRLAKEHAARSPEEGWARTAAALREWKARDRQPLSALRLVS